jgi:glycerol-3-phosphate O-acyltransferase
MRLARLFFRFFLFGQDRLHYIARLGDVREVNLRCNALLAARRRAACRGRTIAALKLRAHLLRFVALERARVGFAGAQAKLCQHVKNLPALDFHLSREIVDSNLTHPPLFKPAAKTPLSCS